MRVRLITKRTGEQQVFPVCRQPLIPSLGPEMIDVSIVNCRDPAFAIDTLPMGHFLQQLPDGLIGIDGKRLLYPMAPLPHSPILYRTVCRIAISRVPKEKNDILGLQLPLAHGSQPG